MSVVNHTVNITPVPPPGGNPIVKPFNLQLAFGDSGEIFFELPADSEDVFVEPGIQFDEPAPFIRESFEPRKITYQYDNNDPNEARVFAYTIILAGGEPDFPEDPTVQNDPPGNY